MTSSGRLLQLTELLHTKVKDIDAYICENNLPDPSFDASYRPVLDLPPKVDATRKAALEALDELRDHLLGPTGAIFEAVTSRASLVGLHGVAHFNMANAFPADSTASIPEIAEKSGMHPNDAETIIRYALTYRLFKQQPNGTIAHSAATRAIATVPHLHAWIVHALDYRWRDAPFIIPAMEKWPGSQELNETAFNLSQSKEEPFFKEIGKSEKNVRLFMEAMRFFLDKPDMRPEFAVEGYAWDLHAEGTVVDVGGSHGVIAFKLAERYPAIKIIVQDRPEVVARAPKHEKEQIEFQAHDFFMAQPVKEADVYFFRYIFHSWSDKYCIAILRALIPALKLGSRVLVMEHIVPEPGILSPFQERPIRHFDMAMKQTFNSKERSENDWKNLLRKVDERFSVVEVRRPAGSQLGIIVVEWA